MKGGVKRCAERRENERGEKEQTEEEENMGKEKGIMRIHEKVNI